MKKIPLPEGRVTLVDDEDFKGLRKFLWYAVNNNGMGYYVERLVPEEPGKRIKMHEQIIGKIPKSMVIIHNNGNGLDNRRLNLRVVRRGEL